MSNEDHLSFSKNGFFSVSPGHDMSGSLYLNGPDSVLHLWSNNTSRVELSKIDTITGVLDDQKKASLIQCIKIDERHFFGDGGVSRHYKFFPHYAVIGNHYFSHSEKIVSSVSFIVDDAATLFHDRESFGTLMAESNDLEKLRSLDIFSKIPLENPVIAYYTGKHQIFSCNTEIGKVSAYNSMSFNMGGPKGVNMRNDIFVNVDFSNSLDIIEMDSRIRKLLRFFGIIIGRPQNLLKVSIVHTDDDPLESSSGYINMFPSRDKGMENRDPDFRDILIDAIDERGKFEDTMCAWLERDETWRIARLRFSAGWTQQRNYDADRIVGAANMFDLLPKEALPEDVPLPSDLATAVQESVERFRQLPPSSKRDAILTTLGNIKKKSLKQIVRCRSALLIDSIGDHIPGIDIVTDAAVDLRHLYVHGDTPDKKREELAKFLSFLTDTLEFVFCVSDLVELEWDLGSWHRKQKLAGHPFCDYLHSYKKNMSELKRQIGDSE